MSRVWLNNEWGEWEMKEWKIGGMEDWKIGSPHFRFSPSHLLLQQPVKFFVDFKSFFIDILKRIQ